jgi:hypothetical protein
VPVRGVPLDVNTHHTTPTTGSTASTVTSGRRPVRQAVTWFLGRPGLVYLERYPRPALPERR